MAKKAMDDDFEEELDENLDEVIENSSEEDEEEEDDFDDDCEGTKGGKSRGLDDDDDDLDILIEIDEDDLDLVDENPKQKTEDSEDDIVLSKHKLEGKHSLKYDSIFKGKKEDPLDEDDMDGFALYHKDTIEVDKSSNYYFESIDNEAYVRTKLVKERVYAVLSENTELNFLNNRRKPSRSDFNQYFNLIKNNLESESFTNIELFNELAVYFSDNLFNMLKLLDNKWRNQIFKELQEHVGKTSNSKEVQNRNIYEGTEIEFEWEDEFGEPMIITGVVMETDYTTSTFKVDSYENIYNIHLTDITKILNNNKFKNNLNKLNNLDFL
jgi:hypothetical protein